MLTRFGGPICVIMPNFVLIGQTVAGYCCPAVFRFLQDGGRPPSWICFRHTRVWTTKNSIWWSLSLCKIWLESVQQFRYRVRCKFSYFSRRLENAYWLPTIAVLGIWLPKLTAVLTRPAKGTSLSGNTYVLRRVDRQNGSTSASSARDEN